MAQAAPAAHEASKDVSASTLTPALFKRLHPRPFLDKFLEQRVRPDGRRTGGTGDAHEDAYRDASVNIGSISTAPSSALVRFGQSTLVCGITLETAPPDIAAPHLGFIVPNVDLSPLCSGRFRPGPPTDEAQALATRLRDIIIAQVLPFACRTLVTPLTLRLDSSNVLPLSALVIEPGKAVFVVYLDVVCLNYDGGILDAAMNFLVKLPKATWDPDTQSVICDPSQPGTLLPISSVPISVSFGIVNNQLLPDPTQFESTLCTSQITITLAMPLDQTNRKRSSSSKHSSTDTIKLVSVSQAGSTVAGAQQTAKVAGADQLKACISLAKSRAQTLKSLI
ncbi:hypothetical protein OIV83_004127 [Microbotryomycetes sp. JL201]|nr:hypothetical protein OIV83_004127 [Microbotryomycetes sp. JL201]